MKHIDFIVSGDPAMAKATAERALTDRKFRIKWQSDWSGIAERGNKFANALIGAFAQYFKVGVELTSNAPEQTTVRIIRMSRGSAGGIAGMARTNKNMSKLKDELSSTFQAAGVLQDVQEGKD